MTLQSPLEFALSVACFACFAPAGWQCRTDNGELRDWPHFGRVGMPSSRGWSLRYEDGRVAAERAVS
jgi:hypothetical protein